MSVVPLLPSCPGGKGRGALVKEGVTELNQAAHTARQAHGSLIRGKTRPRRAGRACRENPDWRCRAAGPETN